MRYEDVPEDRRKVEEATERSRWTFHVSKSDFLREHETFSRLLGKVVLPPPAREKSGVWPFEADNDAKDIEFIIGVDDDGDIFEHTSSPDSLANFFGANPEAPDYLTPVYFRREVMLSTTQNRTGTTSETVTFHAWAFGDARSTTTIQRTSWSFWATLVATSPMKSGCTGSSSTFLRRGGISETNFRRSFLAQWTEAEAPDLVFKQEYSRLGEEWSDANGWALFLELGAGDEYLVDTVRVPVTNSQAEMDEQVLTLTKLLIDSLNEKALEEQGIETAEGTKGIGKLDAFFEKEGFAERESVIRFLRQLQNLRSTGSGHRKGKAYEKAVTRMGLDTERRPDAISRLLEEATAVLRAIRCISQGHRPPTIDHNCSGTSFPLTGLIAESG